MRLAANEVMFWIGTLLVGSVIPITFNLSIGLGGELFSNKAGTITGMIATTSSISTLFAPAFSGWLIDKINIDVGFSLVFVFGFAAVVLGLLLNRRYHSLRV